MLVTVSALLVVVLVIGSLLLSRVLLPLDILNTQLPPASWIQIIRNDIPYLFEYVLTQDPIDTDLVSELLQEGELQITFSDLLRVGDIELQLRTVGTGTSMLIDPDGILLGASDSSLVSQADVGLPLDTSLLSGLEGPVEAALQGDLNADNLFVTLQPNEEFFMAVPLSDESGHEVLGVVIIYIQHLPTENDFISNTLAVMGRSAVILLFSAALVGLLFGFLTAKGMVDRLQHASDVTDAWSQGDFSEFIQDPGHDEIGHLGVRLNQMAQQLKELLARREQIAVIEERNRLARDLHDSAKQQALAASFQIGTALTLYDRETGVAKGHLAEAERLVDSVRQELTDLIMELRPQDLEEKPIDEILIGYALDWSHQHEIEVEHEILAGIPLSIRRKQTLLRILQEGLANIARHSQATQVEILLSPEAENVIMVVSDNGVGFEPDRVAGGIGLHSMHERAESLGGSMQVTSKPGEGTIIRVKIPQAK
jgi:NarL family two-component system sensor histidine kinase LiaS